jgi:adenosylmethionine-8-amino-7-oxononanoate aminotransferase
MKNNNNSSRHVFYRRMGHVHPMITHGEGVYLYDNMGKRYLDGSGGAIVVNTGHGVSSIVEAIDQQTGKVAYIHPTMFTSVSIEKYAEELSRIVPLAEAKFYFLTSGSEAVEAALKLARQIQFDRGEQKRYLMISRWMSYHGLSMGALAVTGKHKMRKLYRTMFQDVPHIPPPYCYRCPFKLSHPNCMLQCATSLEDAVKMQGPELVSAFIAEPVSGATLGAVVPPNGYWPLIRQICDHYGILLIADEVMTGMGRTGKWFGVEQWDLGADIITIGKGAASGYFPLSITATKGEYVDLIAKRSGDFSHGGTYSHHAVGAAAGLATLEYLSANKLVENVKEKGNLLEQKLRQALSSSPFVGDIRGIGLMWGVEFVRDVKSKQPFDSKLHLAQKIADEAFRRGLVVYPGSGSVDGILGDHIMLGPPFCIEEGEIEELVAILKESLTAVLS